LQNYDISKKVTTASDCLISDAKNDSLGDNPANYTVNLGTGFFDTNEWTFGGKIGGGDLPSFVTFTQTFTGNDWTGGSFTFTQQAQQYDRIMFVFKSSDNLVAYLLGSTDNGSYSTPFTKPPFTFNPDFQSISHISVYVSGDGEGDADEDVPEPASMALLGIGALGLVSMRRKKLAKA
jgi:hypothetical protein